MINHGKGAPRKEIGNILEYLEPAINILKSTKENLCIFPNRTLGVLI